MRYYYPVEYKALFRLGWPIAIGQIGLTFQNLADNIMVGQHSTQELAAVGFVNSMFVLTFLLTLGFSLGSVSQIGALYSQDNKPRIVEVFKSSIVVCVLQCLLMCLVLGGIYFALPYMGQPEELLPLMRPYLIIQLCTLPIMAVSNAFKQFTDSINDTSVAMIITVIGNVWNIAWNWILIFGHCGFPEMGIVGAGLATASSRVLITLLFVAVFFLRPKYKQYVALWREHKANSCDIGLLNRLGWPIAIQMGAEVASFTIVTIFLGWMGTNVLAANQVMISITNFIFMFYVGISSAVSIRVSNHNGLGNIVGVRHAAFAGLQMIFVVGGLLCVIMFTMRHDISMFFTDSEEVASIVAVLFYPLVLYQVGDGTQVIFANALRGLGAVKKLMKYSFICYVLLSLPLSYLMGVTLEWGALGVWMAFPISLSVAGFLYARHFLRYTQHLATQTIGIDKDSVNFDASTDTDDVNAINNNTLNAH